jgi:hypothetical protein
VAYLSFPGDRNFDSRSWSEVSTSASHPQAQERPVDIPDILPDHSERMQLLMRTSENFLGMRCSKDFLLVSENCFLIRENFIQNTLVPKNCCLILKQRFLVFQNGRLMAEDRLLVR